MLGWTIFPVHVQVLEVGHDELVEEISNVTWHGEEVLVVCIVLMGSDAT